MWRQDRDIGFEVPDDWVDCSVAIARAPNGAATLAVAREALGESLRAHADRQLAELGRRFEGFDLLEQRTTTLAGRPAIHMRFAWRSHVGAVENVVTMTAHEGHVTTFTATTARALAPTFRPVFARILAGVEVRDGSR